MAYCKHCGAELIEGGKFCKYCGTPVGEEIEPNSQNNASVSEPKNGEGGDVKHNRWGRILKVSIPTILIGAAGMILYGKFVPNVDNPSQVEYSGREGEPEVLESEATEIAGNPTGMTDEEMKLNAVNAGPTADFLGSKAIRKVLGTLNQKLDTDGIEGIESLDGMSENELESYEIGLYGYSPSAIAKSFVGTWKSVGGYSMKFKEIENLSNIELANLIDSHMTLGDNVKFIYSNHHAEIWSGDHLSLSGKVEVGECANFIIETASGERGAIWMFSPTDGVLFNYLFYVDDDGTEMASGVKYNRVSN